MINKELTATLGNIKDVNILVLDIFESRNKDKNYILYTIDLDDENIYASIINKKKDGSIILNPVTSEEEIKYIEHKVSKLKSIGDEVYG